jgi:hypothetical protein
MKIEVFSSLELNSTSAPIAQLAARLIFFRSNLFIFEPKVEKIYMGVFSTQFVPLISILAPKLM